MVRGISESTVKRFNLGILKDYKVNFYNDKKNVLQGIFKHYNNKVKNGIVFPIVDPFEGVLGFSTRNSDYNKEDKTNIKYFITSGFKKKKYLCGLNRTLKYILKENRAFIFEGVFDMLAAYDNGIKSSLFICGKSISEMQLALLLTLTDNITLAFDSDDKGIKSMKKESKKILKQTGILCSKVFLDLGEDPWDFFRNNGREDFYKLIF